MLSLIAFIAATVFSLGYLLGRAKGYVEGRNRALDDHLGQLRLIAVVNYLKGKQEGQQDVKREAPEERYERILYRPERN